MSGAAADAGSSRPSQPIDHDLAHKLADLACDAKNWRMAVELLERAELGGRTGALSSIRTANRLLNLRPRLDKEREA